MIANQIILTIINIGMTYYGNNESPRRGEIFQLQQAIGQCFRNQRQGQAFSMLSLLDYPNGEETLKLKNLRNKMSIFELKDLVTELLQMVRTQYGFIKRLLLDYKCQIKNWQNRVLEDIQKSTEQRQNTFKILKTQINQLKLSEEKWISELKVLRAQISTFEVQKQQYKELEIRKNDQIEKSKSMFLRQKQSLQKKMQTIKKDSYKTYEENFDLQQKINSLQDQLEQEKEQSQFLASEQSKQIKRLTKSIQCFNITIKNKEQQIIKLKENVNLLHRRNRAEDLEQSSIKKRLNSTYYLNIDNINKDKKISRESSYEKTQMQILLKMSPQTMEYMKPQMNRKIQKQQNILRPYIMKMDCLQRSSHSRYKTSTLVQIPLQKSKYQKNNRIPIQKLDFNLIQLEIDRLSDKLQSDLRKSTTR